MNKNISTIAGVILVSAILVFSGCTGKATGGGQFFDQYTGHKVTFAFNINLKDNQGAEKNGKTICGSFQLVDHETKQKFHVNEMTYIEPTNPSLPPGARFIGNDKDGNYVEVWIHDLDPDPDFIEIWWYYAPPFGYMYWSGFIVHGYIQYHE